MLPGDVNERRKGGSTWLHQVITDKKEIGWVEALLDAGAKVNALTDDGICPLLLAASVGNPDVVKVLIAHGADMNCAKY
jgi:ankyrin repeat protein